MEDDHLDETYSVLTADEESLFANDLSDHESTDGSLVAVSLVEDSDDYEHSTDGEVDDLDDPTLTSSVNDTPRDGGGPFRFGFRPDLDAPGLLPGGASWMTESSDDPADATMASSHIELVFPDPTSSCSSSSSTITDPSFSLLGLPGPATEGLDEAKGKDHEHQYLRLLRALRKADALEEWLEKHPDGNGTQLPPDIEARRLMTTRERADALETWLLEKRLETAGLTNRQTGGYGSERRRMSARKRSEASTAYDSVEDQIDTVPRALRHAVQSVTELVCIFARLVDVAVGKMFQGWLPLILFVTIASDVCYQYSMAAGSKTGAGFSTADQPASIISATSLTNSAVSAISRARELAQSNIITPLQKGKRAALSKKKKPFVMPSGRDRLRRHFARIQQQSKAAGRDLRNRLKKGARDLKAKRRNVTFKEMNHRIKAAPSAAKHWTARVFTCTSKAVLRARGRADQIIYKKSDKLLKTLQSLSARVGPVTKCQLRLVRDKLHRSVKRRVSEKDQTPSKRGMWQRSDRSQAKTVSRRSRLMSMFDRLRRAVNQYLVLQRR